MFGFLSDLLEELTKIDQAVISHVTTEKTLVN